ncbi:hypothetical protein Hanom_Chr09g00775371 [Helianthus anomalus]
MEQDFHKGFLCWSYNCLSTEAVITYKVENEVRHIHVYDPMWIINCSARDIECLFVNNICYKVEDRSGNAVSESCNYLLSERNQF